MLNKLMHNKLIQDMPTIVIFNNSYRRIDNTAWSSATGDVIPIVNINKPVNARMLDFEIECIRDLDIQFAGLLNVFWEADLEKVLKNYKKVFYNHIPGQASPMKNATKFDLDYSFLNYNAFKRPYKVFSNFCSTWKRAIIPSTFKKSNKKQIVKFPTGVFKDPRYKNYVSVQSNFIKGGRKEAKAILDKIGSFKDYETNRNMINIPTTFISAYLNFGCVSIREVAEIFQQHNNKSLLNELWWREFYNQICYFYPEMLKGSPFYEKRDRYWVEDKVAFHKWKTGTTGYPIIDASMRCLNQTGFLHNRCRMIVASFLIKDMGLNWRQGEEYFASQLIDFYQPSNNGGWQYISGTGPSSMMQTRKFNPWLQSAKYDPDAIFIKKYIPELKNIPPKDIHSWDISYSKWTGIYIEPKI